jgi:cellulose synthase/poly-beta-1,6-N-acetylglucosamine synthase-like glycosyltransferase
MNSTFIQVGIALAQAVALLMSVAFITYVVIIVVPFSRHRPSRPGDGRTLDWHLFVPALNEDQVIGGTVDYLRRTFPLAHVWVIDDASDDLTGALVAHRAVLDPMVHVVSRRFPDARTGKGHALNAAYRMLSDWLPLGVDRRRVIIGVIDADGRPAANCLDVIAGADLFGDPVVGSVQIQVRMMNRHDPRPFPNRGRLVNRLGQTLVQLQDLEFRVPISAIQCARRFTKSVGLGGNGQFSRVSALDTLADTNGEPWKGALLEDYELSLHLMMTGHRNEYTPDTYVDQEALPDIRRLVRQRTRWGQGTMQCGLYLRQLWTSPHVGTLAALEATYYLLQPWLQLIGTLVYPIPAAVFVANYLAGPAAMRTWATSGGWMIVIYYLVLGVGPFVLWGPIYRSQCERRMSVFQGLVLGLGYSLFVCIFYLTSWRAVSRIVRHREDWFKTRRNAEFISEIDLGAPTPPVSLGALFPTEPGAPTSPQARQLVTVMNGETNDWQS